MAKPTILVIDDEEPVCDILNKILRNAGYNVLTAIDAAGGLQAFQRQEVDLVLLDLVLPDGDGMRLMRKLIAAKPHVPVVLISSFGTIARAVQATKEGAYDFLEKPLDRNRLLLTVRNALTQQELKRELERIQPQPLARYHIVGNSPAMQKIYEIIERAAPTTSPVLITGEPGVGKELVANAIHDLSPRRNKRLIKINCSAIPDTLLESEFFGHKRGAFTGAHVDRPGRFQLADKSTLFLDEVGDLSPTAQAKLLRFLENHEIQPVGANEPHTVDVRVIAATNKDLQQMVKDGLYREDLFYRLDVIRIHLPPLRERREDIPALLDFYLDRIAEKSGRMRPKLSSDAMQALQLYDWPGNVRQLCNFVQRLLVFVREPVVGIQAVQSLLANDAVKSESQLGSMRDFTPRPLREATREFERAYLLKVLDQCDWNISKAAKQLAINRVHLYRKMQQLHIDFKRPTS